MPNYEKPTLREYLRLLRYEVLFLKLANEFKSIGNQDAYLETCKHKRRVMIERICMKAALRRKNALTVQAVSALG